MSRRTLAAAVVGSLLLGACGTVDQLRSGFASDAPGDEPLVAVPVEDVLADPEPEPTTAAPSPEAEPTPTPSPTPEGPTPEELAAQAAERDRIAGIQTKLTELGYYAGAADGDLGPRTRAAVMAFQKVQRIGADGSPGPQTEASLAAPVAPVLKGGQADRIEVDLDRQVVYVVKGGALVRVLNASSGSGETYETKNGNEARSLTPVGDFKIVRRIVGEREADLGVLYDPLYIYKGWALHGSNHVPAYPASHGCVRLQRWDATWLAGLMPNGTQVRIYGGTYTFPIGSNAAGTDAPAGDTGADAPAEEPSASPSPTAAPSPSASPSPSGSPSPSPSGSPSPEPSPSGSPSSEPSPSASPSPSESESEPSVIPTPSDGSGH